MDRASSTIPPARSSRRARECAGKRDARGGLLRLLRTAHYCLQPLDGTKEKLRVNKLALFIVLRQHSFCEQDGIAGNRLAGQRDADVSVCGVGEETIPEVAQILPPAG